MEEGNPLVYVGLTYLLLWGVGIYLKRQQLFLPESARIEKPKLQGSRFSQGLRVAGIGKPQIDELKELIASCNESALSLFIANYRPEFVEIDAYFNTLRDRFLGFLDKPTTEATEIEKISAANRVLLTDHPRQIPIRALNPSELRAVYSYNPGSRLIDAQFVTKFAGEGFMERFRAYCSLRADKPVTLHVPKSHNTRPFVDALLGSNLIIQGKAIPFNERLEVASLKRLQDIATQIKIDAKFRSVSLGIASLKDAKDAEEIFSSYYKVDDLFRVLNDQQPELDKTIESEWSMIQAYTKLLCHQDD